jgi:hypothetical protein
MWSCDLTVHFILHICFYLSVAACTCVDMQTVALVSEEPILVNTCSISFIITAVLKFENIMCSVLFLLGFYKIPISSKCSYKKAQHYITSAVEVASLNSLRIDHLLVTCLHLSPVSVWGTVKVNRITCFKYGNQKIGHIYNHVLSISFMQDRQVWTFLK